MKNKNLDLLNSSQDCLMCGLKEFLEPNLDHILNSNNSKSLLCAKLSNRLSTMECWSHPLDEKLQKCAMLLATSESNVLTQYHSLIVWTSTHALVELRTLKSLMVMGKRDYLIREHQNFPIGTWNIRIRRRNFKPHSKFGQIFGVFSLPSHISCSSSQAPEGICLSDYTCSYPVSLMSLYHIHETIQTDEKHFLS